VSALQYVQKLVAGNHGEPRVAAGRARLGDDRLGLDLGRARSQLLSAVDFMKPFRPKFMYWKKLTW
jgi:hypothetical protein